MLPNATTASTEAARKRVPYPVIMLSLSLTATEIELFGNISPALATLQVQAVIHVIVRAVAREIYEW